MDRHAREEKAGSATLLSDPQTHVTAPPETKSFSNLNPRGFAASRYKAKEIELNIYI